MNNEKKTIYILDASIFINHLDILQLDYDFYTVDRIAEELRTENAKLLFDLAIMNKRLILKTPSINNLKIIANISRETGDFHTLSEVDKQLMALALEIRNEGKFDPIVLTEDYSIQNILIKLNIKFITIINKGIKNLIYWKYYCPECQNDLNEHTASNKCPICGSELKRKQKIIKRIK